MLCGGKAFLASYGLGVILLKHLCSMFYFQGWGAALQEAQTEHARSGSLTLKICCRPASKHPFHAVLPHGATSQHKEQRPREKRVRALHRRG